VQPLAQLEGHAGKRRQVFVPVSNADTGQRRSSVRRPSDICAGTAQNLSAKIQAGIAPESQRAERTANLDLLPVMQGPMARNTLSLPVSFALIAL